MPGKERFYGDKAMKDRGFNFGARYDLGHNIRNFGGTFSNTDNRSGSLRAKVKARKKKGRSVVY